MEKIQIGQTNTGDVIWNDGTVTTPMSMARPSANDISNLPLSRFTGQRKVTTGTTDSYQTVPSQQTAGYIRGEEISPLAQKRAVQTVPESTKRDIWDKAGLPKESFDINAFDKDPTGQVYIKADYIEKNKPKPLNLFDISLPTAKATPEVMQSTQPEYTPHTKGFFESLSLPQAFGEETTQPQATPEKKVQKTYTEDEILNTMTPEESQMADKMVSENIPNSDIYNAINAYRNGVIDKDFKPIEPSYQKVPEEWKTMGLSEKIGQSFDKRTSDIAKTQPSIIPSDIIPKSLSDILNIEQQLQTGGAIAGLAGDVIADLVGSAYETAGSPGKEQIKSLLKTESGQQAVQAISQGAEAYNQFKKENPRVANDLENVVNIASVFPTTKGTKTLVKSTTEIPQKIGTLAEKGVKSIESGKLKKVLEITKPVLNKKEQQEAIAKGLGKKEGILGTVKIQPTKRDIEQAQIVQNLVKEGDHFGNIQRIRSEIDTLTQKNIEDVKKNDAIFNTKQITSKLQNVQPNLLTKSDEMQNKVFNTLKTHLSEMIAKKPKKLSSLLEIRKEFDSMINNEVPGLWDREALNPLKNSVKSLRNSLNDYIQNTLPEGATYKESLRKQNLMIDALENISAKSPLEGENIFGKATKVLKNNPLSSLAGLGIAGVSVPALTTIISSPMALSSLAGYGTYKIGKKAITSDMVKNNLQKISESLKKSLPQSKNPTSVKEQIKAISQILGGLGAQQSIPNQD